MTIAGNAFVGPCLPILATLDRVRVWVESASYCYVGRSEEVSHP